MARDIIIHGPKLMVPIPEKSLGEQIYESLSKSTPHEIAYIDAITGEQLTYPRFFEQTCRLAQSFHNCGYKANDVITISSENNINFFIPAVAALYLGIVIAPLNHTYTGNELLHAASITKPKIVICSKNVLNVYLKLKMEVTFIERIIVFEPNTIVPGTETLDEFINKNCELSFDIRNFRPITLNPFEHLAVVLCSSGTTGLPKGVMTTHDNISTRISHTNDPRFSIVTRETLFGVLPFFHGFGFMINLSTLMRRNTIVSVRRFDENLFLKCIEKYKISTLSIVPPIMLFLARHPMVSKYDVSSVQEITSGAAPLSKEIEDEVRKRFPNAKMVRQGYGLTEATLAVVLMPVGENKTGSSGKVVPGMSCKVIDPDTGKSLGPNTVGELYFKGRLITKGYYENPEATKITITDDGWLRTGDLGYYDKDGYFFIVDRLKELIKYKGFQVAPAELEGILLKHPRIKEAGVVGLPDEEAGELPVAFVVKKTGVELTEKEVKQFIANQVSRPKQLHGGVKFVNEIPKNPSGKILRRQLREMLKQLKSKL